MPIPPNTTAATAVAIGSLPYSVTQDVHDAGTNYTVWYKYTATAADLVISVFPWGGGTNYLPYIIVYRGDTAATITAYLAIENESRPVQIPVDPGQTYWFEIIPNDNSTPAILTLTADRCIQGAAPLGSIFVPDDSAGFPATLLSTSTGLPLRFIDDFPAGESSYVLADGYLLTEDITGSIKLYAPGFVLVTSLLWNPAFIHPGFITGRGDHFYVGNPTSTTTADMPANSVRLVNKDGTFGPTTWTPTNYNTASVGSDGGAIAVSPNESILYWHTQVGTQTLKAWDLVNNVALPDVATGPGGYNQRRQILVLADGTILALYVSSPTVIIRRYSTAGAVLNTYTYTSFLGDIGDNQIQIDHNADPTAFWFWHKVSQGISVFRKIRTSDGVELSATDEAVQYEVGAYFAPMTATPLSDCGHSESCPFIILPFGVTAGGDVSPEVIGGVIGPLVWVHIPREVPA